MKEPGTDLVKVERRGEMQSVRSSPAKVLPDNEYGWSSYLATALTLIMYSDTLEEAKMIAGDSLLELTDSNHGASYIPQDIRVRWAIAAGRR